MACATYGYGIEIEYREDRPPLPLDQGSRLPPQPPIRTTFAGGNDEPDPSEVILADRALRLIERVQTAEEGELPSLLQALRVLRRRVDEELVVVRITEGQDPSELWLSYLSRENWATASEKLLAATLRGIDGAIVDTETRMRDLFIPSFASELM